MADETYGFTAARTRLEDIVTQVRRKDTSLEQSLDLLEEGVKLANACTEQIDRLEWTPVEAEGGGEGPDAVATDGITAENVEPGDLAADDSPDAGAAGGASPISDPMASGSDADSGGETDAADDAAADDDMDDAAAGEDPSSDER
jgi:exodeoxyribonuclease VII small subunit